MAYDAMAGRSWKLRPACVYPDRRSETTDQVCHGSRRRAANGEAGRYFREHVQRETDECILWPFATTSGGYGSVHVDGKVIGAHVAACIRANGPCPVGLEAAHTCHVPGCFNPRHLRWKTHASNLADRIAAGTAQRGERSPSSKLTAEQVRSIRATYAAGGVSLRLVGLDYGVSTRTIHAIVTGENWAVA